MPKLSLSPATVPTNAKGGRSTRGGDGGGADGAATVTGICAGGGRRDGEKIGRSRVLDSVASGIAQSGLALSGRGRGAGFGNTGRTWIGAGVSHIDGAGGPSAGRGAGSSSMLDAAIDSAVVEAGRLRTPASMMLSPRLRGRIVFGRLISRPAIGRRR